MYKTEPLSATESAIDTADLADWLGDDDTDPLLSAMTVTATSAVIEYLQSELVTRSRRTVYEFWPTTGTNTMPSISRNNECLQFEIALPYARLDSITTIQSGGEAVDSDYYRVLDGFPTRLLFNSIPAYNAEDYPALYIEYDAGYGAVDDVPTEIKTAILMCADFLYNNRGSCSAYDALQKSGAATLLTPFRAQVVLL